MAGQVEQEHVVAVRQVRQPRYRALRMAQRAMENDDDRSRKVTRIAIREKEKRALRRVAFADAYFWSEHNGELP
jgi:hypothetical protein